MLVKESFASLLTPSLREAFMDHLCDENSWFMLDGSKLKVRYVSDEPTDKRTSLQKAIDDTVEELK